MVCWPTQAFGRGQPKVQGIFQALDGLELNLMNSVMVQIKVTEEGHRGEGSGAPGGGQHGDKALAVFDDHHSKDHGPAVM